MGKASATSRGIAEITGEMLDSGMLDDAKLALMVTEKVVQAARELHREGHVSDKAFAKITAHGQPKPVKLPPLAPPEIAKVREVAGMSQAMFAAALNVPRAVLIKWESGERKPSGAALKLLTVVKNKGLAAIK
jgi:putative transcriptional regulator